MISAGAARTKSKINAAARRYLSNNGLDGTSESDVAAEATRQAVLAAYIDATKWPAGTMPHAHFCGALAALWCIAIAEVGQENAEMSMLEMFEWGRDFALEIANQLAQEGASNG